MIESVVAIYIFGYVLFSLCIVFPPTEFISAGLTLDSIFYKLLGEESIDFVCYQLRRTSLNIIAHSLLPLGCIVGLYFVEPLIVTEYVFKSSSTDWFPLACNILLTLCILLPISTASLVFYWQLDNWQRHPFVYNVLRHYDANDWTSVANQINIEWRRLDKFLIRLAGGLNRVIVTDSFIMVTQTYSMRLSQQQDARLTVIDADEHAVSHHSEHAVQFLNIRVENVSKPIAPFIIRLNSLDYSDMKAKLHAPIEQARDIIIHQSLSERFVTAFSEQVQINLPHNIDLAAQRALENCIGCLQETANVKLVKRCTDDHNLNVDEDGRRLPNCYRCYCRPMWCMGRWFASRQDPRRPENWLSGKSPCPTCRAIFCILDVCLVTTHLDQAEL